MTQAAATAFANALKILRTYGFNATATRAEETTQATQTTKSVVIVGEVKRGKSELVNALLETPHASPTDVDVATSAALYMVPENEQFQRGWVDLVFPGETRRVPVQELPDWVTQRGKHVADPNVATLPTRAVVPVPLNLFDGAPVVDTPGGGGLHANHSQLALASAQQACVLVVVADASGPLTAPEMEFIKTASASTESVVVVVTKSDKNLRRWRAVVDEDKRLLAQHLRRTPPVVGVSSLRALAACQLPEGDRRDGYLQSSGITELRQLIRDRLANGENLAMVNGMRTALEGLRSVLEKIHGDMKDTKDGELVLPELTEQRDQLQQLKEHSGEWELRFSRDMTLVRQHAMEELDKQLEQIRDKWTNRVNESGMKVLRSNPQVFTAEIEADLMGALGNTVNVFLAGLYRIVSPLFPTPEPWYDIYRMIQTVLTRPDHLGAGEVISKKQGLVDPSTIGMGMGGFSMAGTAAAAIGFSAATAGVGAVAAVIWVGVGLGYKAMRSGKGNLLSWLRETVGNTKTTANRMLEAASTTSRTEIVLRYRTSLRQRTEEVAERLNAAKLAKQQDVATRKNALDRLAKNEQIVNATIAALESAIAQLNAAPAPPIAEPVGAA